MELQNPNNRDSYLQLAEIKPSQLLNWNKPKLLDEWQIAPVLWDAVRVSVDKLKEQACLIFCLASLLSIESKAE